jgi:hypothetical protein
LPPRPAFAAELGRRLTAAITPISSKEEAMPNQRVPHRVETYLSVSDPRAAIASRVPSGPVIIAGEEGAGVLAHKLALVLLAVRGL